jgi:hypothetical protein
MKVIMDMLLTPHPEQLTQQIEFQHFRCRIHHQVCTSDNDDFYSSLVVELCAEQGALLLLAKQ